MAGTGRPTLAQNTVAAQAAQLGERIALQVARVLPGSG